MVVERDRVGRAISRLPVDQRTVMVLHFFLDLPLTDAADILDIPSGPRSPGFIAGLEALRETMSPESDEPSGAGSDRHDVPAVARTARRRLDGRSASGASDAELIDRVVATTSQQRPRARWMALLREAPMRTHARVIVGSPTRRMALVVALLILGLLAAVGAGSFLLQRQPQSADWPGFRGGSGHDGIGGIGPVGNPVLRWTVHLGAPIKNNSRWSLDSRWSRRGRRPSCHPAHGRLEQWRYRPGTSLGGSRGIADLVYVTDGRGILHGLDVATGAVRWDGSGAVSSASAATVSDGSVFVGTSVGHVVAFDAGTGVLRWEPRSPPASEVIGSPAVGAGLVFAASPTGGLVAIRPATGEVAWRFDTRGDPLGTVAYADGIAYVGTPSGAPRAGPCSRRRHGTDPLGGR